MVFECFNSIYEFIARHLIFFINCAIGLLIFLTILYFFISFQESINSNKTYRVSRKIAFILIVTTLAIWLIIAASIVWSRKHILVSKNFYDEISYETSWIKENIDVYFIKDKELLRMNLNGDNLITIFQKDEVIRECHFSFDGSELAIMTDKGLYLLNIKDLLIKVVYKMNDSSSDDKYLVSSLRWSPDSSKIFYKINRWNSGSLKENVFIHDISKKTSREIKDLRRDVSSPYWDSESKDLYFFKEISLDTSRRGYPFELNIYKLSLDRENIELVTQVSQKNMDRPLWYLESQGIKLQIDINDFSFGRSFERFGLVSSDGGYLAVDKDDFLYYINGKLVHKKLFALPRDKDGKRIEIYKSKQRMERDNSRVGFQLYDRPKSSLLADAVKTNEKKLSRDFSYYWENGELLIDQLRWTPSGKLVVLSLRGWGILVLDPMSLRISMITNLNVDAFGWVSLKQK